MSTQKGMMPENSVGLHSSSLLHCFKYFSLMFLPAGRQQSCLLLSSLPLHYLPSRNKPGQRAPATSLLLKAYPINSSPIVPWLGIIFQTSRQNDGLCIISSSTARKGKQRDLWVAKRKRCSHPSALEDCSGYRWVLWQKA